MSNWNIEDDRILRGETVVATVDEFDNVTFLPTFSIPKQMLVELGEDLKPAPRKRRTKAEIEAEEKEEGDK